MNWYSYCAGNPVNMWDPWGLKPGDLFTTLDEAAVDAGNYYLEQTYKSDEEMCGLFYQNIDGLYTYQDVENKAKNKKDAFSIEWEREPLAVIHTHVYRDVDDLNNQFSYPGWTTGDDGESDVGFVNDTGIQLYLAAPTGELKLYNSDSVEFSGTIISKDLVVDPKITTYHEIKNTLIWNLIETNFPDLDKMDIVKSKLEYPNSTYCMLKKLNIID